jgi:ATP-dependent Clp protease ATP-binding subunit ClpA
MNGYNFTERVRKVLAMAREEAEKLHHEYVGTEHLLLALLREGEGVAATVLTNLGADLTRMHDQLLSTVRAGRAAAGTTGPDLPYTSRAKKVLELAMSEARQLHHSYVGTEHLLLGLVGEEKGIAAQVLFDNGCTLDKTRTETARILGTEMRTVEGPETCSDVRTVAHLPHEGAMPPWAPRVYAREKPRADRLTGMVFGQLNIAPNHLSSRAIAVVSAANIDAVNRKARKVGAEHLARAVIDHGEGSATAVLRLLGADMKKIRQALEASADSSDDPAGPEGHLDLNELLSVLGLAENERALADAPRLATHHLLLGAIMSSPSVARAMNDAGVDAARIRAVAASISG